MGDRIARAQKDFHEAALELEAASKEALIVPEAAAVSHFVRNAREQLPAATTMIITALRAHSRAVTAGSATASLPRPAPAAPQLTVVPQQATQEIFIMRASRYLDPQRGQVALGAHRIHALPLPIAKSALQSGAGIPVTDPRRRTLEGSSGMVVPELSRCFSLDDSVLAEPKKSAAPSIASSSTVFEPHPDYINAQPKTFTIPNVSEPVVMGARSLPEDEQQS